MSELSVTAFSDFDHRCMTQALQLAEKGWYSTQPNPRVGCVIANDQHILGQGFHQQAGQAHAEINALHDAIAQQHHVRGATAYVTLEPCSHTGKTPPCADALIQAGIGRVVAAMTDPNPLVAGRGLQRLADAGIMVDSGLCQAQAELLNRGFIKRMTQKLPWVRVKMAMSLDGRTAMASGESQWITGEAARQDVQRWRAQADAILTGAGTVIQDNPSLNVRLSADELAVPVVRQPLRVILDRRLRTPISSKIFQLAGETLLITENSKLTQAQAYPSEVSSFPQQTSLRTILHNLANEKSMNEVHVEAGATLAGAFLAEGLVDEVVLYIAPHLMGHQARGLFDLPMIQQMQERITVNIQDIRAVGDDWRMIFTPQR